MNDLDQCKNGHYRFECDCEEYLPETEEYEIVKD